MVVAKEGAMSRGVYSCEFNGPDVLGVEDVASARSEIGCPFYVGCTKPQDRLALFSFARASCALRPIEHT